MPVTSTQRPCVLHLLTVVMWGLATAWPGVLLLAETPDPAPIFGPKHLTVHQVKGVVGPSVQIDDQGRISAAWVEEDKETRTILFAKSETPGGPLGTPVAVNQPDENPYHRQEAPALIVRGQDVFVAWSMAHPKMTPDKPFSGELRLSRSSDGGRSFGPSTLVNDDNQVIQHTFDALQVAPDGVLHRAWIDGREGKKDPGTFVARSTDSGRTITKNFKVDDNTCVCCRTSIATSDDGIVYVAWRKIFDGNVRETVVSRSTDGGQTFSQPIVVGNDRWVYQACPHRPASLGVDRLGRLYVVWYTPAVAVNPQGMVVMGWKEHAMPAHRLVVQTMQLPGVALAEAEIRAHAP